MAELFDVMWYLVLGVIVAVTLWQWRTGKGLRSRHAAPETGKREPGDGGSSSDNMTASKRFLLYLMAGGVLVAAIHGIWRSLNPSDNCSGRIHKWTNNCFGSHTNDHGTTYVGRWTRSVLHGQGKITWANGTRYEGEVHAGVLQGQGTIARLDGWQYVGEFNNGELTGHGTITWPDGSVYEGQVVKGKRHGEGAQTWPNGSRYTGQWSNGNRHGLGTAWRKDGSVIHDGAWANGNPVR